MVEFAGWSMPVEYTSLIKEHNIVRSGAGLFDVSHMGEIALSGPGAEALCRRLLTNDVRALAPGSAHYSLIANERGGVVDDVIVYRLEPERFMLCVNAANADKDLEWIRSRSTADCKVDDASDDYALIALQGPQAVAVAGALGPELVGLGRFKAATARLKGIKVLASRTGYTGEDGYEFYVAPEEAVDLWRLLGSTAVGMGIAWGWVGLGARDTLRLEAALPLYGHELAEDISPFEVGLGWTVKLNRPDMSGYRALEESRVDASNRRLLGLEVKGGIARQGHPVVCGAKPVGMVTSGSHCPTLGKAVALALAASDCPSEGLSVEVRGKARAANVTTLPFYVRQHGD